MSRLDLPRLTTGDVVAGITVALVLIPQSLAYAEIAGLPAFHGLYAAAVAPIAAALFASSPYLQTGPVAMTSLLTFGALSSIAGVGGAEYVALAALLALAVGIIRAVLGLMRAGVIAYLMSQPVLAGFTTAAVILIASSQMPTALGVSPPDGRLLQRAWWAIIHPGNWETTAVVLSVITVTLIWGGRKISALFPGVLIAAGVGLGYSLITDYGGAVIGDIPQGLPPFSLGLPWSDFGVLLVPAAIIALVGFAEPAAIARTYAAADRTRWSADRELISSGFANMVSGVAGGYPVGGSFSRSSITRLAGGKTRWSGAVTGLVVLAFLPFASVLEDLPRAILGATVIAAVATLLRFGTLFQIARSSIPQGLVAWTTFAATLYFSPRVERGVLVGIGLGIAVHLWREHRGVSVGTGFTDGTLTLSPRGVMYFASAPRMDETLLAALADHPDAQRLVIDLSALGRIDYTGARALHSLAEGAKKAGLEVLVTGTPPHALQLLTKVWGESLPTREVGG